MPRRSLPSAVPSSRGLGIVRHDGIFTLILLHAAMLITHGVPARARHTTMLARMRPWPRSGPPAACADGLTRFDESTAPPSLPAITLDRSAGRRQDRRRRPAPVLAPRRQTGHARTGGNPTGVHLNNVPGIDS
jgi:hypothetical protein